MIEMKNNLRTCGMCGTDFPVDGDRWICKACLFRLDCIDTGRKSDDRDMSEM